MAEYYISWSTGNDGSGHTGGISDPFKTLSKVSSLINNNTEDTFYFMCGDDWTNEASSFSLPTHGSAGRYALFKSYNSGSSPILPRISAYSGDSYYSFSNIKFYTNVESRHPVALWNTNNFMFFDCEFELDDTTPTGYGMLSFDVRNLTIKNCTFTGGIVGLNFRRSENLIFIGNSGTNNKEGTLLIYDNSSNAIILNNSLVCTSSAGAGIELGWDNPRNCIIANNFINSDNHGIIVTGTNNQIYNNIIKSTGSNSFGIVWTGGNSATWGERSCYNNKVYNNTVSVQTKVLYIASPFNSSFAKGNIMVNNIFITEASSQNIYLSGNDVDFDQCLYIDNNVYYKSSGNFSYYEANGAGQVTGFSNWQNNFNVDSNSWIANPNITWSSNIPYPASNSFVKYCGKDLGLSIDYLNKVRNKPGIGAVAHST